VDGNVTQVGNSYIVAVSLVTADSGRELTSFRATAAGPEGIIDVADELARKLRAKSGESLRAVNTAPSLARVTTSSLEALRKYSEGQRANGAVNRLSAIRHLRDAVTIDSTFAEAWRLLGVAMSNYGMARSSIDSAITRAYELRDRLPESARDRVIAQYYSGGARRVRENAIAAYERMLARGDSFGLNNLALLLGGRRQFERAEELMRASVQGGGATVQRLSNLIGVLRFQGKWAEADSVSAVMQARYPNSPSIRRNQISAASDRGDLDAWRRGVDSVARAPDPETPAWALYEGANIAFAEGRATEANRLLRAGWRIDSTVGRPAPAIAATGSALQQRIDFGLATAAEVQAMEAALAEMQLSDLPAIDAPYFAVALSFARAGRPDRAREIMTQYRAAADTAQLRAQRPGQDITMGWIAVAEKRWDDAVRLRRAGDSLPDGPAGSCVHCLPLHLVEIFAEAGMADSALAQWEVYKRTPWGSRPRTGPDLTVRALTIEAVGRMYELRGDTANAVEAYREFVERWKNADPELQPRVVEARKRLEALTPVERVRR
jgi:hypothetical protein